MTIKISALWDEVAKVAAEQPDHSTGGDYCQYQRDGKPSCIVGHALYRLGVPVETLANFDSGGFIDHLPGLAPEMFEADSDVALRDLRNVQDMQDQGVPWGRAVETAQERTE